MPTAAAHARQLGQELYQLVSELEPARWEEAEPGELRDQFMQIRREAEAAIERWAHQLDVDGVETRLRSLAGLIDEHLPSADAGRERWMSFREQVYPAYEDLAEVLSACHVELPSLRPTNYARSASHAFSGVLALLFAEYVPWPIVIATAAGLALSAWGMEIARRFSEPINDKLMAFFGPIAHSHERYRVNSATWFCTALLLLSLTGQPLVCAAAVLALGFGDPAAALVGRKWGRIELLNNRTLEGSATFFLVAGLAIFGALSVWHAPLGLTLHLTMAGVGGLAGAVTELFSRRVDDNFAIPVATGAAVWLVTLL